MNPRRKQYFIYRMVRDRVQARKDDTAEQKREKIRRKRQQTAEYQNLLTLCDGIEEEKLCENLHRQFVALYEKQNY